MDSTASLTLEIKDKKWNINIAFLVISLIILAGGLNQVSQVTPSILINRSLSILRTLIYFGLFISWGLSIRKRVMQKQVKTYLTIISGLMVFWLAIRSIKYFFVMEDLNLFRHLWYAYYIPELMIALLSLFIALSMRKPESYRLALWTKLLYLPTLTLIGLVLTNDYHGLVFILSDGITRKTIQYKHNIGFWIIFAWLITCGLIALMVILSRSKVPRSKRIIWLPFLPLLATIVYTFIFVFCYPLIAKLANDVTIVLCLLIMSIFEASIYTGLIRSNRHYHNLFYASAMNGLIVDKDYKIHYKSKGARDLPVEILKSAQDKPVNIDENIRLSSLPITGGHTLWLEDISEINQLLGQLKEAGRSLSKNNDLLQAELQLKERQAIINGKDRLYNKIVGGIDSQLDTINKLLKKDHQGDMGPEEKLTWLSILGAYIKRRSNLLILSEEEDNFPGKEVEYSLRESVEALSESAIDCFLNSSTQDFISAKHGLLIYDIFQEIIELALPSLEALLLNLEIRKGDIKLTILLSCQDRKLQLASLRNFKRLKEEAGSIQENLEDDSLQLIINIPGEVASSD